MTRFRYIGKMHKTLRAECPEGYSVQAVRVERRLLTVIRCDDSDYFAPWFIGDIVDRFGFDTRYA